MKIRTLIITLSIIMYVPSLFSQDIDPDVILKYMEFPERDLKIGILINNPIYALTIRNKSINIAEVKKTILSIEKELSDKSKPDVYFQLGNYYKELMDNENSLKYYKKFLTITNRLDPDDVENIKILKTKGEIYYSLSETDLQTDRIDNLEKSLLFFKKAIELNPDDVLIWIKLGDCFFSLENFTEALNCYNKYADKNNNDFLINSKLQAASFQRDYLKLSNIPPADKIEDQPIVEGIDFDYIQVAINNSPVVLRESFKLQHYIYLLRLMLVKSESFVKNNRNEQLNFNSIFTKEEKTILIEAENFLLGIDDKNIRSIDLEYLSGIVSYLQSDYLKSVSTFKKILNENVYPGLIDDEILFISLYLLKDSLSVKKMIEDAIKVNPDPKDYLLLAGIEFKNKNLSKAEMLCYHALKIDRSYPDAYSGIAVISALNGNYIAADEMIKKGNFLNHKADSKNIFLSNQMKLNEAVIAFLKNEKERAYILLRSVISVDNNAKASELYNRYFSKK